MYLCVLSSTPDDPNDKPYDPSPHMNGFQWKHHPMQPRAVGKQIRDLMETGDALIFGIPTINRDIPKPMWDVLAYLSTVRLKTNIAAVFGSYGWSGEACRLAEDRLKGQNFKLPVPFVGAPFTPRAEALEPCEALGRTIAEEVLKI